MRKREHCEPAALESLDNNAPVVRARETLPLGLTKLPRVARGPPRGVDVARVADICAGALCGSNLARAAVRNPRAADAEADSPVEASPSRCHSTGTAHAAGSADNCGCWLHTQCVGFHQLLCAVVGGGVSAKPGIARFHQAEEQSPGPKSARLSKVSLHEGEHSPRQESCAVGEAGEVQQIGWQVCKSRLSSGSYALSLIRQTFLWDFNDWNARGDAIITTELRVMMRERSPPHGPGALAP